MEIRERRGRHGARDRSAMFGTARFKIENGLFERKSGAAARERKGGAALYPEALRC